MAVPGQARMGSLLEETGFKLPDPFSFEGGQVWQVAGNDSQALVVHLQPGQEVMCEPGALLSMTDGLTPEVDSGGYGLAFQRSCCAGESCFRMHYKNDVNVPKHIVLSPSFPGKIVPLNMDNHPSGFNLTRGSWMGALGRNAEFGVKTAPSVAAACCASEGCCMTTFNGKGMSWINGGGTVLMRELKAGETITVDTEAVLAWEGTVKLDVKCTGGCMMMCFGGSGIYNTELTGPGMVYVHSMSVSRAKRGYAVTVSK